MSPKLTWKRLSAGHYVAKLAGTRRLNIDRYTDGWWLLTLEDENDTEVCEELDCCDNLSVLKHRAEVVCNS